MKKYIYSVYDCKAEMYFQPMFLLNDATARRAFQNVCNQEGTEIEQNPADFTLMKIGEWDDSTGQTISLKAHVNLGNGLEYKREELPPVRINLDDEQA